MQTILQSQSKCVQVQESDGHGEKAVAECVWPASNAPVAVICICVLDLNCRLT